MTPACACRDHRRIGSSSNPAPVILPRTTETRGDVGAWQILPRVITAGDHRLHPAASFRAAGCDDLPTEWEFGRP
jgi:hypothetical protein